MKPRKRFYKRAAVTGEGPFAIALDDRPIKTPYKHPLLLESRPLAEAIAAEWQAQEPYILPPLMRFTSLAFSAIDHVAGQPTRTRDEIMLYAGSDLVCYRATEPEGLVERQAAHWDPILKEAGECLSVEFTVIQGLTYQPQPPESLTAMSDHLTGKSPLQLSAIYDVTTRTGSALIALCLAEGRLTADAAWTAAHVDEDWQNEQWGQDLEARERREALQHEFGQAAEFLRLASGC